MAEQQGVAAHAGGGKGGLSARMPPAYNNNIIFIKYLHNNFGFTSGFE